TWSTKDLRPARPGTSERITHTTHQAPRTEHGHQAPTRRRPVDYGPAAPGDGQSTRPDGHITRTLGNPVDMPAAVRAFVPPHLCATPPPLPGRAGALVPRPRQAAPRCRASHTAVDSRAPSSIARPQWAIQAAMPSGVPDT